MPYGPLASPKRRTPKRPGADHPVTLLPKTWVYDKEHMDWSAVAIVGAPVMGPILAQDYNAGKVGKTVYSKSRKNLPIGRPKRIFNRESVIEMRRKGASIRQIAKQLGVGAGTVMRAVGK